MLLPLGSAGCGISARDLAMFSAICWSMSEVLVDMGSSLRVAFLAWDVGPRRPAGACVRGDSTEFTPPVFPNGHHRNNSALPALRNTRSRCRAHNRCTATVFAHTARLPDRHGAGAFSRAVIEVQCVGRHG